MIKTYSDKLQHEIDCLADSVKLNGISSGLVLYSPVLDLFFAELYYNINSDAANSLLKQYDNGLVFTRHELYFEIFIPFAFLSEVEAPWDITYEIISVLLFAFGEIAEAYSQNSVFSED